MTTTTNGFIQTTDNQSIHYAISGSGETTLIFLHGWLGNLSWWNHQRDAFSNRYQIIQMDLIGHGNSTKTRDKWSIDSFADDVIQLIKQLKLQNVVLIGHSMSGSIVLRAANHLPNIVNKVILVDTLHHVCKMPTMEEVAPLFAGMRSNYQETMTNMVPMFTFAKSSPIEITQRLISEFTAADPAIAIASLEPFYSTPIDATCRSLNVPVRAIQSDLYPTDAEANKAQFKNYDLKIIPAIGHYPMLEAPLEFNNALNEFLLEQSLA